ncbi:hypothetical protein Psi01_82760 [Planobispora siamensis]|uniref:Aminoglycoside N(3)-acetyltransferase n=1 Tax=Planobispora siamensis TaxID=936338 RepID=A0A8J3SNG8_9ACTN|nr:hypothetical protein Psi01_82760 [Planobispora siamensis]
MTCGWNDAPPYDFVDWPQSWQSTLRAEHPAYDSGLSEADHNNGRLPEALRRWPGAVRSRHPDASFAALGTAAAELMADHPWDDPMARTALLHGWSPTAAGFFCSALPWTP